MFAPRFHTVPGEHTNPSLTAGLTHTSQRLDLPGLIWNKNLNRAIKKHPLLAKCSLAFSKNFSSFFRELWTTQVALQAGWQKMQLTIGSTFLCEILQTFQFLQPLYRQTSSLLQSKCVNLVEFHLMAITFYLLVCTFSWCYVGYKDLWIIECSMRVQFLLK